MRFKPPQKYVRGFTLIELMLVVVIIGILSSIAYPSYMEYVRRSKRADASAQLMAAANYMHRFYSANDSYATDKGGVDISLPSSLTTVPADATSKVYYNIEITDKSATGFTLTAEPAGSMDGDACGSYKLNAAGQLTSTSGAHDKCVR